MSESETIERVWSAPIDLVWELWTSAEGIASWFGPKGFEVVVDAIELREGGAFRYTMNAASPETAAMMEKRGRPASFSVESTVTVVQPPHRFTYTSPMPGGATMTTAVEFTETDEGVAMVLVVSATADGMLGGAMMGWRSTLERLAEVLAAA